MATIESLMAKLEENKPRYYSQEDFVLAGVNKRPGEDQQQAMRRLNPGKTEHPWFNRANR